MGNLNFPAAQSLTPTHPPTMSSKGHDLDENSGCNSDRVEKRPVHMDVVEIPLAPPAGDGVQAWATVLGSFLIMFCGFGYSSSFGVYQDFYVRTYMPHSSPSAISWIGSVNIFIVLSGGFIAGRLHDRGYFYALIYTGSLLTSLSLFLLSLARPNKLYQIFLSQGLAHGLGSGMTYVPCIAVLSQHFSAPPRRALAMTLVASGSSLGAVVHPLMLNALLPRLAFGTAVRASAALVAGLLFIACVLVRTRLPPPKTSIDLRKLVRKIIRDKPYAVATLALGIYTTGFYYPLFYLQLRTTTHGLGLPATFAFSALVIMNSASFIGRLVPGFLTHRLGGVPRMITFSAGAGAVLILCMLALRDEASVVVVGVLYGFFAGAIVTLMSPLLAVLTQDMSELGARMGISVFVSGLGILVGPPIDGLLLTDRFIWWRPAVFSGIMAFVGFALFVLMLVLRAKAEPKSKESAIVVNVELDVAENDCAV